MTKSYVKKAAKVLEEAGMKQIATKLNAIAEDTEGEDTVNLINRNHYFATILWQEKDIAELLRQNGYKATQENIDAVLCEVDTSEVENCEHGWDVIQTALDRIADDLEK